MIRTILVFAILQFTVFGTTAPDPWKDEKRPPVVSVALSSEESQRIHDLDLEVYKAELAVQEAKKRRAEYVDGVMKYHSPDKGKDPVSLFCGNLVYQSYLNHGYIVYTLTPLECRPA